MGSQATKTKVLLMALLFALSVACTAKEKKESGKKEAPAPLPTPTTDTDDNPCLRLQDDDDEDDEDEDEEAEAEDDESTEDEDADEDTASDDDDEVGSTSDCGSTDPEPSTPSPSGGSGGTWNEGPGLEACAAEGKAWVAVKNGGPAECGPALVTWCCSEAEILKQFASSATKLQAEFDKRKDLKLYHCSFDGTETRFHWAKYGDSGVKYSTVWVKGAGKVGGTAGDECTKVTSADLGLPAGGEDDEDDDEVVEVGDDIPATIGSITDTSKDGLLAWVKTKPQTYGSKDATVRTTTAHGKIKGYYSGGLKDSMGDFDTKHPRGSIAVLKLYETNGTTEKGFVVMAKATEDAGANSWLFYKIEGAPDFEDAPTAYGLGVDTCADCHGGAGAKDFIKRATLP